MGTTYTKWHVDGIAFNYYGAALTAAKHWAECDGQKRYIIHSGPWVAPYAELIMP